jgi:hypothetical protein
MRIILFSISLFAYSIGNAQSLKKYTIGDSGCAAYFFCNPGVFEISYSEDSAKVFTGSCKANDSLTYGLILVHLKDPLTDKEVATQLTESYLDYLKQAFEINSAAGYGKGHTLNGKPSAIGIIDYWQDKQGAQWKIKAWADGHYLTVLYVYAAGVLSETNKVNVFLDGIRFPGM